LSTNSPDAPGNAGAPNENKQEGDAGSNGVSGKVVAIAAVGALALGLVGFFVGQMTKEDEYKKGKPAYEKIYKVGYNAGFAAGQNAGTAAGKQAGLAAGKKVGAAQGLQVGKKAGEAIGQQQGQKAGEQAGYAKGFEAGVTKGANAALGSLTGWNTDIPYVVELDSSPVNGVPYQVFSRTLMKANVNYYLCGNTACSEPRTP